MSLEKKIRALQDNPSNGRVETQELILLHQKVEQIRAYKCPENDGNTRSNTTQPDHVATRITFPPISNGLVKRPSVHDDLYNPVASPDLDVLHDGRLGNPFEHT